MKGRFFLSAALGVLIAFAALARGAHDLWSATFIHTSSLLLFSLLILQNALDKDAEGLKFPLGIPALAIVMAFLLSFRGAVVPSESLIAVKDWFSFLLLFYVAVNTLNDEKNTELIAMFVVPVFWIQAAIAAWQFVFAFRETLTFSEAPSTLVNANIQTAFCFFWLPVLWERAARSWYWRSGIVAALVAFVTAGSTFGWVVGILFFGWRLLRTPAYRWTAALAAAAVVALLVFKFALTDSPHERFLWWHTALQMLVDRPWFGVGLGNFPSAYLAYKNHVGANTLYAHSIVFELLSETGVIGFLAVAAFAWLVLMRLRRATTLSPLRRALLVGASATMVFCLVELGLEYLVNLICLGVILGAAFAGETGRGLKPRLSVGILAVGCALLAIPTMITPFMASRVFVTGLAQANAAKWNEADKSFATAFAMDPLAWEAIQGRARVAHERYLLSSEIVHLAAAADFQRTAIRLNQMNGLLWQELGVYTQELGQVEESERCFDTARRFHARRA